MVKQLNGLVHWNRYFRGVACAIVLILLSFQPAFGATKPDGTLEITDGKEQFMSTLASMPYTSSGTGPVLYLLECSTCPFSQAFEKDWKGQLDGVELRRILIALNATTANEAAYLPRTRDITDFYAFMNRTKVAPPVKACNCPDDNKAIQAVNSVVGPFGKVLKPIMLKNGWSKSAPAPPQFMWETNGRVYVGRYSKNSFQEIMSILRSGSQTTQVSAPPSSIPAPDSTSILKESSASEMTEQVMPAEKNSPNPDASAPTSNRGSQSVGNGGSGPDVLGLRIGMTLAEARAIFKSRVLVSDSFRQGQNYAEGPNRLPGPVPNGNYTQTLYAAGSQGDRSEHNITAAFAPVPGHEEIVSLMRSANLRSKQPTFDSFMQTLLAKYGTPTYGDPKSPVYPYSFFWSYDSNGVLQKPGFIKDLNRCESGFRELLLGPAGRAPLDLTSFARVEKLPDQCGAIQLKAWVQLRGPAALVERYGVNILGVEATIRALKEARAIIDNAAAVAREAAIKKGQQQKPEF